MLKIFALVAALAAVVLPQAAHAQVTTGQNGVCCAYINDPTTRTGWQLVCNKPALVSHHQPNGGMQLLNMPGCYALSCRRQHRIQLVAAHRLRVLSLRVTLHFTHTAGYVPGLTCHISTQSPLLLLLLVHALTIAPDDACRCQAPSFSPLALLSAAQHLSTA